MTIKEKYEEIKEKLQDKAVVVAVTKNVSAEKIKEAYESGIRLFGESKVQEAEEKLANLGKLRLKAKWHMIGHLQSNKVKKAVRLFDLIQSVDSINLAELIGKAAKEKGKVMDVFLQVNIGMEPQKHGVNPHEAIDVLKKIISVEGIRVKGLMAIPPIAEEQKTRKYFKQMRHLFTKANAISDDIEFLSIGMSDDFMLAVSEGANMVRIGRLIFGER